MCYGGGTTSSAVTSRFHACAHARGSYAVCTTAALPGECTDDIDLAADDVVEIAYDKSIKYYCKTRSGCDFYPEIQAAIDSQYGGLIKDINRKIGYLFRYVAR
jgi:hypothetical protein